MEGLAVTVIGSLIIFGLFIVVFFGDNAAKKRKSEQRPKTPLERYFSFDEREFNVNSFLKSTMNAEGEFHNWDESLSEFPALAAGLLKYKKHEWVIVGFEKNKRVTKAWLNKGPDGTQVSTYLSNEAIVRIAKQGGYSTILTFHNHPASDPANFSYHEPSSTDLETAKYRASIFSAKGLNLLSFVCVAGRHYQYFTTYADKFVAKMNGRNGA